MLDAFQRSNGDLYVRQHERAHRDEDEEKKESSKGKFSAPQAESSAFEGPVREPHCVYDGHAVASRLPGVVCAVILVGSSGCIGAVTALVQAGATEVASSYGF